MDAFSHPLLPSAESWMPLELPLFLEALKVTAFLKELGGARICSVSRSEQSTFLACTRARFLHALPHILGLGQMLLLNLPVNLLFQVSCGAVTHPWTLSFQAPALMPGGSLPPV